MPCENCENEMHVTFWASALSMGHAQKSLKAQQTSSTWIWCGMVCVERFPFVMQTKIQGVSFLNRTSAKQPAFL